MNRLLCALVILLVLFVSISSFAEENPTQPPAGQATETQAPAPASSAEEYKFEPSEIEKKPYHIGGYLEFRSNLFVLDRNAALYKLKFFDRDEGKTIEDYNGRIWLEGSYEKGIAGFFLKTNLGLGHSYQGWDHQTRIYEGYLSLKPSSSLTFDLGKRVFQWGKGYAWNPVAFVDRPKDPDDPELPREGYVAASADYIKSFSGPLKTFSVTPVIFPVYHNVNDTFGEIDHLNVAGKAYFLFYDTDFDLLYLSGGSKTTRFGFDFSRNLTTNLEIHGEFAFINNQKKNVADSNGKVSEEEFDAKSYLLGIRYLTSWDMTCILEYYHNGTGYNPSEMKDFFSFIDKGYDQFLASGSTKLLTSAARLNKGNYGVISPMKDYLYLRLSQKEPFNILYFTPAITSIVNLDGSLSISPELLYAGIKNWEFRLKGFAIVGPRGTEFGEKQNDYRVEFRVRYFF
jgi:hypothetical protein